MARKDLTWIDQVNGLTFKARNDLQVICQEVFLAEMNRDDMTPEKLEMGRRMTDSIIRRFRAALPAAAERPDE